MLRRSTTDRSDWACAMREFTIPSWWVTVAGAAGDLARIFRPWRALQAIFGSFRPRGDLDGSVDRPRPGLDISRPWSEIRDPEQREKVEHDFLEACRFGDVARVRKHLVLGMNPNVFGCKSRSGGVKTNALMAAAGSAASTRIEVVLALIEYKVDLNATDVNGFSALMLAVQRHGRVENLPLCEALIDAGADVHAKTRPNLRDLFWFASVDAIELADASRFDVTDLLLQKGADLRSRNPAGESLMMKFAQSAADDAGHACFTLLEMGLDPLELNAQGRSSIDMALDNRCGMALTGILAWQAREAAMAAISEISGQTDSADPPEPLRRPSLA